MEPEKKKNCEDDFKDLIVAEFGYIAQTAFQANEDRARISEFFLISFGTFLVALFSSQANIEPNELYVFLSLMFVMVAFLGMLIIVELRRLRIAWIDSVLAMNQIKDCAIENNTQLANYFRWRTDTVPDAFKPNSVGFLKALQVAALSGLAVGAASTFGMLASGYAEILWGWSILITVVSGYGILYLFFQRPLRKIDLTKAKNDSK